MSEPKKGEPYICKRCGCFGEITQDAGDAISVLEMLLNREVSKTELITVCGECYNILKDHYERTGIDWC